MSKHRSSCAVLSIGGFTGDKYDGRSGGTTTPFLREKHGALAPRSIGTFPKIIGELVRERKISLDAALKKMTSEPAKIFGLTDRGRLQEGMPADLVVFDPDTVSGPADYNRLVEPLGIDYVLVNGTVVARYGKIEGKFPGILIRKRNESPRKIVQEPPALEEKSDVKTAPAGAKHHDVVSRDKKSRVKAPHTTRKAGKPLPR